MTAERRDLLAPLATWFDRVFEHFLSSRFLIAMSLLLAGGLLGGRFVHPVILPDLAPPAGEALANMWQVHAAFASIGFTGIAIASQVFSEPPLSAGPARRAVIDRVRYRHLLAQAAVTSILLGASATWLISDVNVLLSFFGLLVPSILLIVAAYARLILLFGHPQDVEWLSLADLRRRAIRAAEHIKSSRQADALLTEQVQESRFVRHGRSGGATGYDWRPVRYAGLPGVITTIDVQQIDGAAALIASRSMHADGQGEDLLQVVVSLRTRIGQTISPSDTLCELAATWSAVEESTWLSVERQIRGATTVSDVRNPQADLVAEMDELQDSLMRALQERRPARCKRGFEYYNQIIDAVQQKENDSDPWTDYEWRWLSAQTWEVDEVAANVGDRYSMIAVQSAFARCASAVRVEEVNYLAASVTSYGHIWQSLMFAKRASDRHAKEHLLSSLQNLAELFPMSSASQTFRTAASKVFTWTFVDLVRAAMEEEGQEDVNADWTNRSLGYLKGLYRFGDASGAAQAELRAGRLALAGWLLLRRSRGLSCAPVLEDLLSNLRSAEVVHGLSLLADRDAAAGRWDRWETEDFLPFESRVMHLSSFIDRAAALALVGQIPKPIDNESEYWVAKRLLSSLDELADDVLDGEDKRESLATLKSGFEAQIANWERAEQGTLARALIDLRRVDGFLAGMEDALSTETRLSDRFRHAAAAPGGLAWRSEPQLLFVNVRVPKEYFVQTRVVAEPGMLADSIAAALLTAENGDAVAACQRVGVSHRTKLSELAPSLSNMVETMADPFLIIMNSGRIARDLGVRDGQIRLSGSKERSVPSCVLYGIEVSEQVLLVDLAAGPRVERCPEVQERLRTLGSTDVAAQVFEASDVAADPPTARARVETGTWLTWVYSEGAICHFYLVSDAEW